MECGVGRNVQHILSNHAPSPFLRASVVRPAFAGSLGKRSGPSPGFECFPFGSAAVSGTPFPSGGARKSSAPERRRFRGVRSLRRLSRICLLARLGCAGREEGHERKLDGSADPKHRGARPNHGSKTRCRVEQGEVRRFGGQARPCNRHAPAGPVAVQHAPGGAILGATGCPERSVPSTAWVVAAWERGHLARRLDTRPPRQERAMMPALPRPPFVSAHRAAKIVAGR